MLSIKTQTRRATDMKYNLYNINMFLPDFQLGVEMSGWGNYVLLDDPIIFFKLDDVECRVCLSEFKKVLRNYMMRRKA